MRFENQAYNNTDEVSVRQDQPYHHQLPPYGIQGEPYVIAKHKLLYPTKELKAKWSLIERQRLTEQMNYCFPPVYVTSHAVCLIINSLIQIALQIAMVIKNGALASVASGIWGGVYFLITAIVTLFLGNNKLNDEMHNKTLYYLKFF